MGNVFKISKVFKKPLLFNINTIRKYWHAGAGIDDPNVFDRYEDEMKDLGQQAVDIHEDNTHELRHDKLKKY